MAEFKVSVRGEDFWIGTWQKGNRWTANYFRAYRSDYLADWSRAREQGPDAPIDQQALTLGRTFFEEHEAEDNVLECIDQLVYGNYRQLEVFTCGGPV
jgi:hypothetical protein